MTIGDGIFGAAIVFALTPLFYMFVFAAWERFVDIKERRPLTLADNLLDAGRPCNASAPRRWRGITSTPLDAGRPCNASAPRRWRGITSTPLDADGSGDARSRAVGAEHDSPSESKGRWREF